MSETQNKWDQIYRRNRFKPIAAEILRDHTCLLPERGLALDLACGLGGNALLLSEQGLQVEAWDISPVALELLRAHAESKRLKIVTKTVDIQPIYLAAETFDIIVVSRFLDRKLCDAIIASLKPDGLLFYQTFTVNKQTAQGPNNPAYLLQRNELLRLFSPLSLLYYQEHALVGDLTRGARDEASFIGQK